MGRESGAACACCLLENRLKELNLYQDEDREISCLATWRGLQTGFSRGRQDGKLPCFPGKKVGLIGKAFILRHLLAVDLSDQLAEAIPIAGIIRGHQKNLVDTGGQDDQILSSFLGKIRQQRGIEHGGGAIDAGSVG